MYLQDPKPSSPPPVTPTMTIVHVVPEQPRQEIGMVDVAVASFGLTGVIMVAAVIAGLTAGVAYTWYRSRRAITIIEERGGQHNYFRT